MTCSSTDLTFSTTTPSLAKQLLAFDATKLNWSDECLARGDRRILCPFEFFGSLSPVFTP